MRLETVTASGKRKTAKATAIATSSGKFNLEINNYDLKLHSNSILKGKFQEIFDIIGKQNLEHLSFKITTRGGGSVSFIEAARQAFSKAVIAYYGKFHSEFKKQEIKENLLKFDKFTLVSDVRRRESKKVGGPGARSKYQKSYR